ncbi:MAG: pentapeptide repeat-containing protein [Cyanobacteria bacterium J06638_20]
MSRDALVVGINTYNHLHSLNAPASDAEAIAQRLESQGDFQVKRLPQYTDMAQGNAQRVASNREVSLAQLRQALVDLFKPGSTQVPETALLYFSGHGIRDTVGVAEGYLATSDVNPRQEFFGLSLRWLRRLLAESEVRQQVIWLDCCYSGEILNMEEAYPGEGCDRCFIAASRDFEVAYEEVGGARSVMTAALLEGLQPGRYGDRPINNTLLTDYINEALKGTNQRSVCYNSGSPILLTSPWIAQTSAGPTGELTGDCPYKGLSFFDCNDHDPQYFFGRQSLVDKLIDEVRQSNFLAIVGASGSGKSSVLRAGVLHQLKLGQRLRGSEAWDIRLLLPEEHPLQNLAQVFVDDSAIRTDLDRQDQLQKAERMITDGAEGLRRWVQASETPRLVLVIDQFEEVFTLCQQPAEREQFFAILMEALAALPNQLCLVMAMRADFVGKCFEQAYSGLAAQVQAHLVPVILMTHDELTEAICEPARRAQLTLESELVQALLHDVERAPGNLPLLQYTLTELWRQRQDNTLQLTTYTRLGGVTGTLEQRADEVYASLNPEQQATARHIFINLTQLGEGTEDTRRRCLQSSMVNPQHPAPRVAVVVKRLADENLVVTNELVSKASGEHQAVVDVAHEALIRHWKQLRRWLDENRDLIRQQRKIETAAEEWRAKGCKPNYLLQGFPLKEAIQFQRAQGKIFPLSNTATQFLQVSHRQRRNTQLKTASWLIIPALLIGGIVEHNLRERSVAENYARLDNDGGYEEKQAVQDLVRGCYASNWLPSYLAGRIFGNCRSLLRAPLANADLHSVDLHSADLFAADLRSANLRHADLFAADLSSADLRSADLRHADFHTVDLRTADLRTANLSYTNLSSVNFVYADLRSANLRYAFLSSVDLRYAFLRSADLRSTILLATDLREAQNLDLEQLSGDDPPLLCNVALPIGFDEIDPNRDCDRLSQVLTERYPWLEEEGTHRIVDEAMEREWD